MLKGTSKVKQIWPDDLEKQIFQGFDDETLEALIKPGCGGHDDQNFNYKKALWMFWTTEIYGFGRCYREWLGWPHFLPIPVYGDHGVPLEGIFKSEHVLNNPAKYHLVWSKVRAIENKNNNKKIVIQIKHPWVIHRQKYKIKQCSNAHGTLIFHSHSVNGMEIENYDFDTYYKKLSELPNQFHPLVVCLHKHDIEIGYHKKIRKYGFPLVTVGDTSTPFFVDRFYDIVRNFQYATSNTGGSDLFYCEEMGVRYFIFGDQPTYINRSHSQLPLGTRTPRDAISKKLAERKRDLFTQFPPQFSADKQKFVIEMLGLHIDIVTSKQKLRKIFISEMLRLLPYYIFSKLKNYYYALQRCGFIGSLRMVKKKIF